MGLKTRPVQGYGRKWCMQPFVRLCCIEAWEWGAGWLSVCLSGGVRRHDKKQQRKRKMKEERRRRKSKKKN
jgi:hypothetical protein